MPMYPFPTRKPHENVWRINENQDKAAGRRQYGATPYWFKFNPLYVVEQSFGTLHRKFRYARAAYFGLLKVGAQSHLKAMCLNLLKAANRLSAPAAA
ncbi:transposase [Neisseria gonorrhoeae]|uniref:transposase n=1 Tax=Neisseria gonorrhoeae TaxID=485 RepID=UPI003FA59205